MCRVEELPPGDRRSVDVDGRSICVLNVGGRTLRRRASAPTRARRCAAARWARRWLPSKPLEYVVGLEDLVLRCPWHGWEFRIDTGVSLFDPRIRVKVYPVEIEDGEIILDAGRTPDREGAREHVRPRVRGRPPSGAARARARSVDPITLRVLGGAFRAVAAEMAGVLFRMSYSSIIRESEDLGAGVFDAEGRELCESDTTPLHIGSLPWYIRGFLHSLRGRIEEGDVIVHNHPYLGASHTPDIAVAVPIFWEGELIAFSAVTAHVLDVGGSFPGINADAFDMYAEAKIYNGLRWYRRGELNEDLDRMIFDNVRTETMNRGDMNAMLAACQLGRERFLRLLQRYGADVVMSAAYEWMDYSERMLRAEIEKIPDGEYAARPGGSTTTRATATSRCASRRR